MTDLERLWESYPASHPRVDAVLREAHRAGAVRRRRRLTRPLVAATAFTALGAAFVAGTLVSGRGPGTPLPAAPTAPSPVAFRADLPAATSCDQLLSTYVGRGLDRVTAWGWQGPMLLRDYAAAPTAGSLADQPMLTQKSPATTRVTSSDTGTNVQEEGVDEPDTVKTDGSTLVRVRHSELRVYDLTGTTPAWIASLPLPRLHDAELLLSGQTVVALGTDRRHPRGSRVTTISIADPAHPEVTADVGYRARILSARQHGSTVRLVLDAGLPDLGFVQPTRHRTVREALAANRRLVRRSTLADWLPTYTVASGEGSQQLLDCTNVAIPPAQVGLDTVGIVGFDAADPTAVTAIGLAGATTIAYESADDLYLAATPQYGGCWGTIRCPLTSVPSTALARGGSSYLFDFALDGTTATHVATGRVRGYLADRWSLDSADGTLRVAVEPWSSGSNAIVTFRRQGQELVRAGRLGHLGDGESLEAVRWFDDLALLGTYRQVDPLYAVDLADPDRPRLLGRLKVPGYSEYLHPLGSMRLIGVGQGTGPDHRWGAQVGLFDVTDLTRVRRLDVQHYRGAYPLTSQDPRSFTWLPQYRTVLTVLTRGRTAYLATLWLHHGRLHSTLTPVGGLRGSQLVRTVPLPDGRVALVTATGVRFLALG